MRVTCVSPCTNTLLQQQRCNRSYSPDTSYRNGYNSYVSSINNSNRTSPDTSNYESKTYTSTLTIQTNQQNGHEDYQPPKSLYDKNYQQQLDYNRNPTNNEHFNNIDNKLHKLTDDIRDFAFDHKKIDQTDFCVKNLSADSSSHLRAFKVIIFTLFFLFFFIWLFRGSFSFRWLKKVLWIFFCFL